MGPFTTQLILCCLSLLYLSGLIAILCVFHQDEIPAVTSSQIITMINYCLLLLISLGGICFFLINMIKNYRPLPDWVESIRGFCQRLISMRLICVSIMLGILDYIDTCVGSSCYPGRPIYLYAISPPHLVMVWIFIRACFPHDCHQILGPDDESSLNGNNPLEAHGVGVPAPIIARQVNQGFITPIDPTYASLKQCYERPLATDCSICMTAFVDQDPVIMLKCGHFNHDHCLKKWFDNQLNCTLCREQVFNRHIILGGACASIPG